MISLQSLKKILALLGLAVLILFAILYFSFRYILSINEHVSALTEEVLVQNKEQQHLTLTKTMVTGLEADISRVRNSLVASDGDVAFIEEVEKKAKDANVEIKIDSLSLQGTPVLDKNNATLLKVRLEVKGSWAGVYSFISTIESLPYSIKMDKIEFVNTGNTTSLDSEKGTGSGSWQALVEMSVLKYK